MIRKPAPDDEVLALVSCNSKKAGCNSRSCVRSMSFFAPIYATVTRARMDVQKKIKTFFDAILVTML